MTDSPPLLTIVIPTVNRPKQLARALESALAQTVPNIEIIVSDNASTDGTRAILEPYMDTRLRKFRHDRRMTAAEHSNFLVRQAHGTYFLGLSDDDWIEPDFCAKILHHLQSHPDLLMVYTGGETLYRNFSVPYLTGPAVESGTELLASFLGGLRDISWCACVLHTDSMRSLGELPENMIFGDLHFWMQIATRGNIGCVSEQLSHYSFMTADNSSTGVNPLAWGTEMQSHVARALCYLESTLINDPQRLIKIRQDARKFTARSTANHLIWQRIRGSSSLTALKQALICSTLISGDHAMVWRALAAIFLPRSTLASVVLHQAKRLAKTRSQATRAE